MARRLVTTVTILVLLGVVAAGLVLGWRQLTAPLPSLSGSEESDEVCETIEKGSRLRSETVIVSVYNASGVDGLAGETLSDLEARGFRPGEIDNAPEDTRVRRVEVWAQSEDDPAARLVARQFGKKAKVVVVTESLGAGPDVVLGPQFDGLKKAPRSVKVTSTKETCTPVPES